MVALRLFETARLTAQCRAIENRRVAPRYHDSFAEVFGNSSVSRDRLDSYLDTIIARSRIIDRFLIASLPCNAIVNVGSGFDMRSAKTDFAGVVFFEVDEPAVHQEKRSMLADCNIALRATSVSGCFPDVFQLPIWESGTTVCLTEGLLTYFASDDVVNFARNLAAKTAVDHWVTDWVGSDSTNWLNAETAVINGSFEHYEAPPLQLLEEVGFEVVDYQPFSSELRLMGSPARSGSTTGLTSAGDSVIRFRRRNAR